MYRFLTNELNLALLRRTESPKRSLIAMKIKSVHQQSRQNTVSHKTTPAVGTPAVGTPAVGTPAVGTPAVGTPAVGTPVATSQSRNGD